MKKSEMAKQKFIDGASCSQAVLWTFAEDYGLSKSKAFKLGSGFSGGMGRMGKTCGAVTGGAMVLGLVLGAESLEDSEAKNNAIEKVKFFIQAFESIFGTCECKILIGYDLCDEAERRKATAANVFTEKCPVFVENAARILEGMLE
ncbi:C_GCAxxG_C_C family protein [candidate division KSB1 bacterium]|nr:C_GCAxxG_C_C family protein [candidate division KSB1 bacterium]